MRGRSLFSHDEMASAFCAAVGWCGGVGSMDWWPATHQEQMEGHAGDWVVVWDVPDQRLAALVGDDAARAMLAAQEKLERAQCG